MAEVLQETSVDGLYSHHGSYDTAWSLPWATNDTPMTFNYESNPSADWILNQHRVSNAFSAPEPHRSRYSSHSESGLSEDAAIPSAVTSAPQTMQSTKRSMEERIDNAALIEKLCDINNELYHHATTLPLNPVAHPVGSGTITSSPTAISVGTDGNQEPIASRPTDTHNQATATSLQNGEEFAIDKTFSLSHELIGILNQLYPRFLREYPDPNRPSHQPLMQSTSTLMQQHGAHNPHSIPRPSSSLDEGSILLILSSYLRVINIYDTIFSHIQNCISETNGRDRKASMRLPRLNIGAFSLPSCSGMEITLIIQLAEQLLSRLREITSLMDSNTRPDENGSGGDVGQGRIPCRITDTTLWCLRGRERELMKRMTQVKKSLLQLNIL